MVFAYYLTCFLIAVVLTLVLAWNWRKRFDVNFALIFIVIDVSSMGYVFLQMSRNLEEALIAQKIIYLGGAFLPMFLFFAVIRLCRTNVGKWVKPAMIFLSMFLYGLIMTSGKYPLYYKSVGYSVENGIVVLTKEYTVFHSLFYFVLVVYLFTGIAVVVYTYYRRIDVSATLLALLLVPLLLCVGGLLIGKANNHNVEIVPLLYDITLVIYIVIIRKISLYDVMYTGVEALTREGDTGFISIDNRFNYLGSNEVACKIIPEIARVRVDTCIKDYRMFDDTLIKWADDFDKDMLDGVKNDQHICRSADGESVYYVNISYLYEGKKRCGYQFFFIDNTKEYNYNERLKKEVKEKTAHIEDMHNTLIMGMATMVESRDNSTGGHIRRTSELVKMLTDRIKNDPDNDFGLSDEFCEALIKAAPMHDLGKIAVDDAILRKPGKFEPEEFEKMKMHAPEGARIVHEILKDTDDEVFKQVAENMAHYHHERWDGSGYPEGRKGCDIPIEARIMAIADVYDALVSKRVYKDKMSFEKADSIIMEGMGTQFDKGLEQYYVAARNDFRNFYIKLEEEEEE